MAELMAPSVPFLGEVFHFTTVRAPAPVRREGETLGPSRAWLSTMSLTPSGLFGLLCFVRPVSLISARRAKPSTNSRFERRSGEDNHGRHCWAVSRRSSYTRMPAGAAYGLYEPEGLIHKLRHRYPRQHRDTLGRSCIGGALMEQPMWMSFS